jgi:hypothetical protein
MIKGADLRAFKLCFSEALGVHSDLTISLQISTGSLIVKTLLPYQLTLNEVTNFSIPGN